MPGFRGGLALNFGPPAHAAHPCVVCRIFKKMEESQECFNGVFLVCLCQFLQKFEVLLVKTIMITIEY